MGIFTQRLWSDSLELISNKRRAFRFPDNSMLDAGLYILCIKSFLLEERNPKFDLDKSLATQTSMTSHAKVCSGSIEGANILKYIA